MAECRSYPRQSLGFMSRRPVALSKWTRPRISRHAFIEVVPAGEEVRVFGVHLSAVHAAWTERRRVMELRALLRSVAEHQHGFHVLCGDFNTVAPDEPLDSDAAAAAAAAPGVAERRQHPVAHGADRAGRRLRGRASASGTPASPATRCRPPTPTSGWTTCSSRARSPIAWRRATWCGTPRPCAPPITFPWWRTC